MSLESTLFGRNSALGRAANIMGLGVPNWLEDQLYGDPIQGARIGDLAVQTSKEGTARPIIWGIVRPIGGNLIACSDPIIREVEAEQQGGGKGGGGSDDKVYEEHVFRTYAIRICEGPITSVRRVWRNSKLVYDARGNEWGAYNNPVFLSLAKFYLGGWDQLPSPALQSVFGVANVTAHRGTCYVTFENEDLTDLGGAIPQFIFEVERSEGYALTSRPYNIEEIEATDAVGIPRTLQVRNGITDAGVDPDALNTTAQPLAIALRDVVKVVPNTEAIDTTAQPLAIALRDVVKVVPNTEAIDTTAQPLAIALRNAVVVVQYDTEAFNATVQPLTLTITG